MKKTYRYKGLKNGALVPINETGGLITYAPKIPIDLVSINFTPQGESEDYYANDTIFDQDDASATYDVTITMPNVPDEVLTTFLGFKKDVEGMIYEDISAPKKDAGLIFQTQGGEDVIIQFYKATLSKIGHEFGTNTDKSTSNDVELKLSASPAPNGKTWNKITKTHSKFSEALDTVVEPIEETETGE